MKRLFISFLVLILCKQAGAVSLYEALTEVLKNDPSIQVPLIPAFVPARQILFPARHCIRNAV